MSVHELDILVQTLHSCILPNIAFLEGYTVVPDAAFNLGGVFINDEGRCETVFCSFRREAIIERLKIGVQDRHCIEIISTHTNTNNQQLLIGLMLYPHTGAWEKSWLTRKELPTNWRLH